MERIDVAIVGGGPAGSACALLCAQGGLRTVVIEPEKFPREQVCGDWLNPACWPRLRRLAPAHAVRELPHARGYSGQAPVNNDELNLWLVGRAHHADTLKSWAANEFGIRPDQPWRTITPLTRAPLAAAHPNLFLIGDAARVVEPFTGEGIYYALRSGELAAAAIRGIIRGENAASLARQFAQQHQQMYSGRLWINELRRAAVLWPQVGSAFVRLGQIYPGVLKLLTNKIVR